MIGCSMVVKSKHKLKDHLKSHTQEKVVACPTCGALFSCRTKFFDHLTRQAIHSTGMFMFYFGIVTTSSSYSLHSVQASVAGNSLAGQATCFYSFHAACKKRIKKLLLNNFSFILCVCVSVCLLFLIMQEKTSQK